MRCPKCSYISFDHLISCSKCGRDLSEIISQLHGTSIQAELPIFLVLEQETPSSFQGFDSDAVAEGADLAYQEEASSLDLNQDETEEAFSFKMEDNAGIEIDLEQDSDDETLEAEDKTETALSEEDEVDFQLEPVKPAEDEEISPEQEVSDDKEEETVALEEPGALELEEEKQPNSDSEAPSEELTLNLDSIDLSDLSADYDTDSQEEETLDFNEDPLDLWSLDSSEGNEETILDKVSEDIFEVKTPSKAEEKKPSEGAAALSEESEQETDLVLQKEKSDKTKTENLSEEKVDINANLTMEKDD